VRRAAAAFEAGITALEPRRLNLAFVTHLHSDHTAGYPDLILTPWVLEREQALQVYGPAGLNRMTEHILAAYQSDIEERINGPEPANDQGYKVLAHEIQPGMIYQDAYIQVEAFSALHGSLQAFGYRFITPDRTIVISGDTAPHPGCILAYQNCNVLIHEVYSNRGLTYRPPEWQAYHRTVHTSALDLAAIASRVRPGLLILYHQLLWGVSEDELLTEIRENYQGNLVSGKDLEVY
jgi:ribonuclease BN (tRNA processing enzyme)